MPRRRHLYFQYIMYFNTDLMVVVRRGNSRMGDGRLPRRQSAEGERTGGRCQNPQASRWPLAYEGWMAAALAADGGGQKLPATGIRSVPGAGHRWRRGGRQLDGGGLLPRPWLAVGRKGSGDGRQPPQAGPRPPACAGRVPIALAAGGWWRAATSTRSFRGFRRAEIEED